MEEVIELEACQKGKDCPHFRIQELIEELGGLGKNDLKIVNGERLELYRQKVEELGQLVKNFEKEVIKYFRKEKSYPCRDPMQIAWGRRKYQAMLVVLGGKEKLLEAKIAREGIRKSKSKKLAAGMASRE